MNSRRVSRLDEKNRPRKIDCFDGQIRRINSDDFQSKIRLVFGCFKGKFKGKKKKRRKIPGIVINSYKKDGVFMVFKEESSVTSVDEVSKGSRNQQTLHNSL